MSPHKSSEYNQLAYGFVSAAVPAGWPVQTLGIRNGSVFVWFESCSFPKQTGLISIPKEDLTSETNPYPGIKRLVEEVLNQPHNRLVREHVEYIAKSRIAEECYIF